MAGVRISKAGAIIYDIPRTVIKKGIQLNNRKLVNTILYAETRF